MRGAYFLLAGVVGIIILIAGGFLFLRMMEIPLVSPMDKEALLGRRIVVVIAFRDFRDEEYFTPKELFEKAGAKVETASNKGGIALGADGGETEIDYLVENINPDNFDAVVFIGGPGTLLNLDNENSYNLIKQTVARNKVLAAICISPVILAKAGVLKDKSATVWSDAMDKSAIKILQENGAIYEQKNVVSDGIIVTANGPAVARQFAEAVANILK